MKKSRANGFVTALAAVVALAVLVFFSGIYYVIQNSIRENIVIDFRDKSADVAEAALQDVINIVRANPDLKNLYQNMKDPDPNSTTYNQFLSQPPNNLCPTCGADGSVAQAGFFSIYTPEYPMPLSDSSNKRVGMYFAKVKRFDPDDLSLQWHNASTDIFVHSDHSPVVGDIFHIITEGWALDKHGKPMSPATAHAFVTLSNVGDYFCAVKGQLTLTPGAQLANAKVYGRTFNFDLENASSGNPMKLQEVDYMIDAIPDCNSGDWPTDGSILMPTSPTDPTLTRFCNQQNFKRIDNGLVFPSLDEQFTFFKNTNTPQPGPSTDYANCHFSGDLKLPMFAAPWSSDSSITNLQHVYLCPEIDALHPGDAYIGNTNVVGQVIIAAMGTVYIQGSITINHGDLGDPTKPPSKSQNNYTSPDLDTSNPRKQDVPKGLPSKADQLVIYAKKGVVIDGNWCNSNTYGNALKIQGVLVISPDSSIRYDPLGSLSACHDFGTPATGTTPRIPSPYSLDFLGAMFLASQPTLGGVFPDNRNYRYLDTLKTDPPPVREFYEIVRQFVRRRGNAAPIN